MKIPLWGYFAIFVVHGYAHFEAKSLFLKSDIQSLTLRPGAAWMKEDVEMLM
jgi:hypothetical protein